MKYKVSAEKKIERKFEGKPLIKFGKKIYDTDTKDKVFISKYNAARREMEWQDMGYKVTIKKVSENGQDL